MYNNMRKQRGHSPNYLGRTQPQKMWHMMDNRDSFDPLIRYNGYEEESSDDVEQWRYTQKPQIYYQESYTPGNIDSTDQDFSEIAPFSQNPKRVMRQFKISKNKRKQFPPRPSNYKTGYQYYDESSDGNFVYDNERYLPESSETESELVNYNYHKNALPPRSTQYDIISSISKPSVEPVMASSISLNKTLLLSIDAYVNFVNKPHGGIEDINISMDSQISIPLSHRISNFHHSSNKWKESYNEFTLSSSNLSKLLKTVKVNCSNIYLMYIITSNLVVAYTMINEEQKAFKLIKSLDSILFKASKANMGHKALMTSLEMGSKESMRALSGNQSQAYQ